MDFIITAIHSSTDLERYTGKNRRLSPHNSYSGDWFLLLFPHDLGGAYVSSRAMLAGLVIKVSIVVWMRGGVCLSGASSGEVFLVSVGCRLTWVGWSLSNIHFGLSGLDVSWACVWCQSSVPYDTGAGVKSRGEGRFSVVSNLSGTPSGDLEMVALD